MVQGFSNYYNQFAYLVQKTDLFSAETDLFKWEMDRFNEEART